MPFDAIVEAILEGKTVPEESKMELFRADASHSDSKSHGLFSNVAGHLVMVVCKDKGITFEGITHLTLPKLRNAHAYRADFRGRDGSEFNCMCVSQIAQVGTGSFQFLSGSLDHLASDEGCPACDYLGGCEACDRAQMAKLAPPGSGLGLRESEAGLAKAMGPETLESLLDFYRSYHDFRRDAQEKAKEPSGAEAPPLDMPEPMRQLFMADLAVIDYALGMLRRVSRRAGDPESHPGKKLADCHHVEETFNLLHTQLKGFRSLVARVKADPKGMMDHLSKQQGNEETGDDDDEEADGKPEAG